jgi:hypothetical protein
MEETGRHADRQTGRRGHKQPPDRKVPQKSGRHLNTSISRQACRRRWDACGVMAGVSERHIVLVDTVNRQEAALEGIAQQDKGIAYQDNQFGTG